MVCSRNGYKNTKPVVSRDSHNTLVGGSSPSFNILAPAHTSCLYTLHSTTGTGSLASCFPLEASFFLLATAQWKRAGKHANQEEHHPHTHATVVQEQLANQSQSGAFCTSCDQLSGKETNSEVGKTGNSFDGTTSVWLSRANQ